MVPQSLYVTIELVKVGQAKFMEWDNEMGYFDPDTEEYSRCQVKASALNEELGCVDVICTGQWKHQPTRRGQIGGGTHTHTRMQQLHVHSSDPTCVLSCRPLSQTKRVR